MGGLAEIKAGRIQHILGTLKAERGECSLEHLRGLSATEVKAELGRFKVSWARGLAGGIFGQARRVGRPGARDNGRRHVACEHPELLNKQGMVLQP